MKNWSKKKTLIVGISIIAVCLIVSAVYMITNRSTKRQPTQQEIEAYAAYEVDWQALGEGTDREIILSMCNFLEEKTIGENLYRSYDSAALGQYLHNFGEMMETAELGEVLYIQYTTPEGDMITLGYSDAGLVEKAVYDLEADTMYYELNGTIEVWEKFRNGVQWGA